MCVASTSRHTVEWKRLGCVSRPVAPRNSEAAKGILRIIKDDTERHLQLEQLRASEQRSRRLIGDVPDYAIFTLDPRGYVTSWNAGARFIKGYESREIIGSHFSRFYPPDAIERGWPEHEREVAAMDGRFEDEGWRLRKDGAQFPAKISLTPLVDAHGELYGFAHLTQDLTHERQAQALENVAERINEFLGILAHEPRNPLAPIRNAVALMGRKGLGATPPARLAPIADA